MLRSKSYVLGLSPWKNFIESWLAGETVVRTARRLAAPFFYILLAPQLLLRRGSKVYVWGYKYPEYIERFCSRHKIEFIRIEDGFLRSVALGAQKAPPLSLCFDRSGIYFDPTTPSDLEKIIQEYDFKADEVLMNRARAGIKSLISSRLSKYNSSADVDPVALFGQKTRKRILVVGQVEDDASILMGCDQKISLNDVVRLAAEENSDAQIIYKPHPEILRGTRKNRSNPLDVRHLAQILDQDITLADALSTVDHVYTITSLSGFEALLRGIKVTCLGMPFYAGWGATDDRQQCPRRTAVRKPEEIFAAAYLLYPKYHHPITGEQIEFEDAMEILQKMKQDAASQADR